jgi:N-acetylglucosaminyldiphosphoundecaprenol N-acetyl-beta-D-mannosaminyltransferase
VTLADDAGGGAPARRVPILGVPFLPVTEAGLVRHVLRSSEAGRGGWIVTPNLDILRQATADPGIRALLLRADVLVADGMPLIWASRLQRTPLPERVSGSHLIWSVSEAAAARGRTVFLLGGAPGAAEACAKELRRRFPSLRITGTHCPPFGFERSETEMRRVREAVAGAPADVVFVALSFPKGEHLIERIRDVAPRAWWIGVGIAFSFVAGEVKRAPRWVQRVGLEWAHRLLQEPRRLARRYLVHGLPFAVRLLSEAARRRRPRAAS